MTTHKGNTWLLDTAASFTQSLPFPTSLLQKAYSPTFMVKIEPHFRFATSESANIGSQPEPPPKRRKLSESDCQTPEFVRMHKEALPFINSALKELPSLMSSSAITSTVNVQTKAACNEVNLVEYGKLACIASSDFTIDETESDIEWVKSENDASLLFNRVIRNNRDNEVIIDAFGANFVIPKQCSFLMSDIDRIQLLKKSLRAPYDLIITDPPWENKSAIRAKRYPTLPHPKLLQLPVKELGNKTTGCVVAVWVTNRPKLHDFVKNKLFPSWNVEYLSTWYWLKVTPSGDPVVNIDSTHRRTYEPIIVGLINPENHTKTENNWETLPNEPQVIVSVPTTHSRKPPIQDVFTHFCKKSPINGLELFARCLYPNFTSWGNEVLKFQQIGVGLLNVSTEVATQPVEEKAPSATTQ